MWVVPRSCRFFIKESRVEKTLLPKLEFFHSLGISGTDLANILSSNPGILCQSLEKQSIPSYNFLKSFVTNDEEIVNVWKPATYLHDVQKKVVPNISALKGIGVTQKLKAYRSWGWSENDFRLAFRSYPRCMTLSVENINTKMDFYVNKMGWQPSAIARIPMALAYSLEKRIIPRCRVLWVLLLNDLIKKKFGLSYVLSSSEKRFADNFLSKYQEQVPQLFDIYQGKVDLSELGIGF
ncbi:transcription termination factor MTERF15, mitochondrial-like [Pistacia vera]|uniref:transcription termination factor MTERF15, mitochondrial-like n=1 Tax=Pistacia vera TaxID=55513 RepID=UPI0012634FAE|nr:transcription termination factor MTERF15, mitochondrial-like [Pistacia vera]